MTDTEFTHFGIAQLATGEAPLIVPESDRDRVQPERVSSGGVIFTTAESMPSLEELLRAYEVQYAVLEGDVAQPAAIVAEDRPHSSWREATQSALEQHLSGRENDVAIPEEYAFLAAISDEDLDRFLTRAHALIADAAATEPQWEHLLAEAAEWTDDVLGHVALAPLGAGEEEPERLTPPLLSLADTAFTFSAGALGGPPALADAAG